MRILVFGGLGFIGYHLVSRLLSSGHDVTIIDNANDYGQFNKHILDQIYADRYATIADARWIRSDLNGFDDEGMIRSHDMIVMLAGYPSAKLVDLNLSMARSLMVDSLSALCGMIGADTKIAFVSSSMVYGEWSADKIDEGHATLPIGNYGKLKLEGEELLRSNIDSNNLLIFRPSGVYGISDIVGRVVTKMVVESLKGQTIKVHGMSTKLDLTHVGDVVDIMSKAIDSDASGVFNASSGTATTLLELAQKIRNISDSRSVIELVDHDQRYPQRGALSNDRAIQELNHVPRWSLDEGLRQCNAWIRDHASLFS